MSLKRMIEFTAEQLCNGKAVGWYQGRMEFGPRALGNRSILADPRAQSVQKDLNLKIKFRESFRPFAPAVLAEYAQEWFKMDFESPFMLFTVPVLGAKTRSNPNSRGKKLVNLISKIPAVTHVDHSARVQTVSKDDNPIFHRLLGKFFELTGCPVLVNTSFNVRGEPIVCTPSDAIDCFLGTHLDVLVLGNFVFQKSDLETKFYENFSKRFKPD